MSARTEMLSLIKARRPNYSLAGALYSDPEFFKLDLEGIFHREWLFAGTTCELAKPGDYFTFEVGPTSIIVLRDRDGEIRAFHNTCRHRGSRLCDDARGRFNNIVCPYHQWTYDLRGNLKFAGHMPADFDRESHGLIPVHVHLVSGTIYVSIAESPADLGPYERAMAAALAPHDLPNAKLAVELLLVEKGNWKLVMENSRECYHCPSEHPELMRTFLATYDFGNPASHPEVPAYWARMEALGLPCHPEGGPEWRAMRLPFTHGAVSTTMDGQPACKKLLGNAPDADIGSLRWVHYPSVFNHALGDSTVMVRMLPIGPEETLVSTRFLVNKDAVEGVDYTIAGLTEVWDKTNDQDRLLVERNQRGVNGHGYLPGPYSTDQEVGVIRFVDWYCDRMGGYLDERRMRLAAE